MRKRYILNNNFDKNRYIHCLEREINSHWGFEAHVLNLSQIEVTKKTYTFIVEVIFETSSLYLKVSEKIGSSALNIVSELLMNTVSRNYFGKNSNLTYKRYKVKENLESIVHFFTGRYVN